MNKRRKELDDFYRHHEAAALKMQNHPLPNGYAYYPVRRATGCSDSVIHLRTGGPEGVRVEPRAGSYSPPAPPDVQFPNHMRYGFTEREPGEFVHRSALGAVGLSALAVLFVIEFGWWIAQ